MTPLNGTLSLDTLSLDNTQTHIRGTILVFGFISSILTILGSIHDWQWQCIFTWCVFNIIKLDISQAPHNHTHRFKYLYATLYGISTIAKLPRSLSNNLGNFNSNKHWWYSVHCSTLV